MTTKALMLAVAMTLGAGGTVCAMPMAKVTGPQQFDAQFQQVRVVCNQHSRCYHRQRNRTVYYYPTYRVAPVYRVYPSYSYDPWRSYDWGYGHDYSDSYWDYDGGYRWSGNGWWD